MHNLSSFVESVSSLYEGVSFGEKQINDILSRSNDFNVGIEYEMRFEEGVGAEQVIDILNKYNIEYDSVVTEHDDMMEVITPKFSLSEGISHIKSMFSLIKSEGIEVPEMAGMHISISTNKYSLEDFNHLKFLILLDSDYVHSIFPEREHVVNYNKYIKTMLQNLPSSLMRTKKDVENIEWRVMTELDTAKYVTAAVKDFFTSDGRIELRFIGGENYDQMYDDIKIQLLRSLLLMEVAYTDLYDKVYYKKLSEFLEQDSSMVRLKKQAFEIIRNGTPKEAYQLIEKNKTEFISNIVPEKIRDKLENVIAKDPKRSVAYARNILNSEFKKAESVIAKDPVSALLYAMHLREPFPEGEDAIATDGATALQYARMALRGRFEKGEKEIAKHPQRSYNYAKHVLKGRFPEGEDAIASEPDTALRYAIYVLDDRFEKGEEMIKRSDHWEAYKEMYIKD